MKKWNQTIITWPMWYSHVPGSDDIGRGEPTNLPVTRGAEGTAAFHNCTSIIAETELLSRQIRIHVAFHRSDNKWPHPEDLKEAASRVTKLFGFQDFVKERAEAVDSRVFITLQLRSKEEFCQKAIELVGRLVELFSITNPNGQLVGNFTVSQVTYVLHEGRWMTYAELLREKLRLNGPYVYSWTN